MAIGLRGKFVLSLLATTLLWIVVLGFAWNSSSRALDDVVRQGEGAMREQGRSALSERGVQLASFLADALTNPVYYTDLMTVREVVRSALDQRKSAWPWANPNRVSTPRAPRSPSVSISVLRSTPSATASRISARSPAKRTTPPLGSNASRSRRSRSSSFISFR